MAKRENEAFAESLPSHSVLNTMKKFGIVVHGGAGTLRKRDMSPEKEKNYRIGLEEAIEKGYEVLENEGSALDAVESAVRTLENHPYYNAGKGAVFNHAGK